jgi:hypothetical protein
MKTTMVECVEKSELVKISGLLSYNAGRLETLLKSEGHVSKEVCLNRLLWIMFDVASLWDFEDGLTQLYPQPIIDMIANATAD